MRLQALWVDYSTVPRLECDNANLVESYYIFGGTSINFYHSARFHIPGESNLQVHRHLPKHCAHQMLFRILTMTNIMFVFESSITWNHKGKCRENGTVPLPISSACKKPRRKTFTIVNYLGMLTRTCPWSRQLKNRTSVAVGTQAGAVQPQCSGAPHCGLHRTQPLWFCSLFIIQRAACSVQSIPQQRDILRISTLQSSKFKFPTEKRS
jgi:hypothetical protein